VAEAPKVPPHSVEAEQSVLGGLMLEAAAWEHVGDGLGEDDFYRRDHALIYRAAQALQLAGKPSDLVTVAEWLDARGELDHAGGMGYLGALVAGVPSAANIAAYAEIVRERATARALIGAGTDIANAGFMPEGRSSPQLLDYAESRVFEIAERGARGRRDFHVLPELLHRTVDRIDALHRAGGALTGLSSGFTDLDRMTAGFNPGDLVIVAGRPSMGKTAFAMNLVEAAVLGHGKPVAVFSLEMPAEQLVMRMLASLGRLDAHHVRTGRLTDDDWVRLSSTLQMLESTPLYIDDTAGLTPLELRARARRLKRSRGLSLVVVDYLQLMQVPGTRENRAVEISEISRSLKLLAKELEVPVVALSQLNRSLESRPNKRPVMSDLRESGAIEQDADVILFIYRDEVYNEDSADKGKAEIIIAKQRNGPIGHIYLAFLPSSTRFEDLAPAEYAAVAGGAPF
jgi:replicative DNA helicase